MVTRRSFLAHTGGTTLTLFSINEFGIKQAVAAIPGGSLDPATLAKWRTALLIPPVMPRAGQIKIRGKVTDCYEISMKQFAQQILPAGLPATTVWGYGAVSSMDKQGLLLHNAPSLTIEATVGTPVRVKWINDLKDASGRYLPHLLPVDPTLHWANVPQLPEMPGGPRGPDQRPSFAGRQYVPLAQYTQPSTQYTRYTGPVPIVTHVHGAAGVGDESDGYAAAWYLPDARDIPASYARKGSWYDFFAAKAKAGFSATWGAGFATFLYPNDDRASTKWYHDHTLGMTRLNVYAGPAGFYIVRGGPDGDAAVKDSRTGMKAMLPGPAPDAKDKSPANKTYFEIPMVIQDRAFNLDGSLFYPDSRAFFDGVAGPFIPGSDVSPIWNPEFFGNTITVNGNTWPFLTVQNRRYRLRLLNGCQARFLVLDFAGIPNVQVWQIGNEGGLLAAPVNLTAANGNRLLISPAERADLIVDFTQVPLGHHVLGNVGPDAPFGGLPLPPGDQADPATTGQILQFRVVPATEVDKTTPAQFLRLPPITSLPAATRTRPLVLLEQTSTLLADAPVATLLGSVAGNPERGPGTWTPRLWMDPVTENPAVGSTEVWAFYNTTVDAHPMHVHEVLFQVLNRQNIVVDPVAQTVQVNGPLEPPRPWETGFKDTVIAPPGQVTRIKARFARPGQYVWHCHIVEHEDNEMMRPFRIGPLQPGQPG